MAFVYDENMQWWVWQDDTPTQPAVVETDFGPTLTLEQGAAAANETVLTSDTGDDSGSSDYSEPAQVIQTVSLTPVLPPPSSQPVMATPIPVQAPVYQPIAATVVPAVPPTNLLIHLDPVPVANVPDSYPTVTAPTPTPVTSPAPVQPTPSLLDHFDPAPIARVDSPNVSFDTAPVVSPVNPFPQAVSVPDASYSAPQISNQPAMNQPWTPELARQYIIANGLTDNFFAGHPNAASLSPQSQGTFMVLWLESNNVLPPGSDSWVASNVDVSAASKEEAAFSSQFRTQGQWIDYEKANNPYYGVSAPIDLPQVHQTIQARQDQVSAPEVDTIRPYIDDTGSMLGGGLPALPVDTSKPYVGSDGILLGGGLPVSPFNPVNTAPTDELTYQTISLAQGEAARAQPVVITSPTLDHFLLDSGASSTSTGGADPHAVDLSTASHPVDFNTGQEVSGAVSSLTSIGNLIPSLTSIASGKGISPTNAITSVASITPQSKPSDLIVPAIMVIGLFTGKS